MKGGNGSLRGGDDDVFTSNNIEMNSLTGGRKKQASKRKSKSTKGRAKIGCNKKGGMGFAGVIREALVPFGLYALQKRTQRRRNFSKKYMKNTRRKSKRSRR